MKGLKLFRKRIFSLILGAAIIGGQTAATAADFSDGALIEQTESDDQQAVYGGEDEAVLSEEEDEEFSESQEETEEDDTKELQQESDEDAAEEISVDGEENIQESEETESTGSGASDSDFTDPQTVIDDGSEEEDEIEYIKGRPLTEKEEQEQMAPFDTLTSYSTAVEIGNDVDEIPMGRAASYPSYYNAAENGYVTSVKNQEPYGMCWAFGMASLLETSLLTQGLGTYDLSEEHLAYFWANRKNDPLGNTFGDYNYHYGTDDYGNIDYHEGGNDLLASIFLSTWSGMTTEREVPLATDTTHTKKTGTVPAASKAYHASAYLKNAYFSDYSVSALKKLLMANKSVTIMYNAQNAYYNASTAAYSYPSKTKSVNHVVTVVGWDDKYSAKNFRSSSKVSTNGAWIVKNSWGTGWGKSGYFYISYKDGSICELVAASATNKPEYSNNYFYDGTSGLGSIQLYAGEKLATVFKAQAGKGKAEKLGEVTLSSMSANNSYTVQVYTNLKDASDPTSGTPAYSSPVSCRQSMAGVMTFKIPEVLLSQNSLYSIVVTNAGTNAVQYCVEAAVDYGWCRFRPSILAGQSFIHYTDEKIWRDNKKYNPSITPRIKAHTKTLDSAAKMQISEGTLSIYAGEKHTLKASATRAEMTASGISWVSSDTSVATVSGNGTVVAKHPGTATISCYGNNARGIRATCKVTVKLKQTTGVKVLSRSYNSLKLAWSQVSGCSCYEIYRIENNGKQKKMATVSSKVFSWQDTTVKAGNTYIYRIRAGYGFNGKILAYGTCSSSLTVKITLAKVTANAAAASGPCNKISWGKTAGADGYYIYRQIQGKSWQRIAEVKNNVFSYQDKNIQGITSYAYIVRAYRIVDGKKVLSGYTASRYILSYPALQTISAVKKTSRGLQISWNAQKKAEFYNIYRKTDLSSWKKIGTVYGTKTSSYEDATAQKGSTYYYAVRAGVKTASGKILYGNYKATSAKR